MIRRRPAGTPGLSRPSGPSGSRASDAVRTPSRPRRPNENRGRGSDRGDDGGFARQARASGDLVAPGQTSPRELISGNVSRPGRPAKIGGRRGNQVRIGDASVSIDQFARHFAGHRHGGHGRYGYGGYREGSGSWASFGLGFGLGVTAANWNRYWYDAYLPRHHRGWYRGTWDWSGARVGYLPWVYTYSNWGYSPLAYQMGYVRYVNPYSINVGPTVVYDYRRPIIVERPVVEEQPPVDDQAIDLLEAALQAFFATDYERALVFVEESLRINPNDPAAHELRALTLFAIGDYRESAATLNALLAAAPGWDWATMRGLYPSTDVYTRQLRALEGYRNQNPGSADARFVLAYHYLVAGHVDAAERELKMVVRLEPRDEVSGQILESLRADGEDGERQVPANAPPEARDGRLPEPGTREAMAAEDRPEDRPEDVEPMPEVVLPGTWQAEPQPDVTISLELTETSRFSWTVTRDGETDTIDGDYSVNGPVLVLEDSDGGTMLARLTPEGEDRFRFVLVGSPDADPGLTFARRR